MKIRTLVRATFSGKIGDEHEADVDADSGTAWVSEGNSGGVAFRLQPHEFEVVADPAPGPAHA